MANPFCHLELASTDIAKAKTFYSSFFDWKLTDMDMGGGMTYTTFKPNRDRRQPRRRHDAAPRPRSPLLLAPLRPRRRRQRRQRQSQIPRRQDHEGHPGGPQHGLVQHHHRPHRRRPRPLANQEETTHQSCFFSRQLSSFSLSPRKDLQLHFAASCFSGCHPRRGSAFAFAYCNCIFSRLSPAGNLCFRVLTKLLVACSSFAVSLHKKIVISTEDSACTSPIAS